MLEASAAPPSAARPSRCWDLRRGALSGGAIQCINIAFLLNSYRQKSPTTWCLSSIFHADARPLDLLGCGDIPGGEVPTKATDGARFWNSAIPHQEDAEILLAGANPRRNET